jgi:hypothetical protein
MTEDRNISTADKRSGAARPKDAPDRRPADETADERDSGAEATPESDTNLGAAPPPDRPYSDNMGDGDNN